MTTSKVMPSAEAYSVLPNLDLQTKERNTFHQFVFRNKENRLYLFIALIATILQFTVFKLLYPFADFFSDSYSYIYGAMANLDINIWPIGYSWFLRYFGLVSHSDTAVVGFQYFFLILSSLLFFFTVRYVYQLTRNSSRLLYIFLFFNPVYLYISNYINSDPLFAALSLLWVTQLIWIIHKPKFYQVFTQAILLLICLMVRNNAMVYPFVSAIAFVLSYHRKIIKWVGIGLGSLFVLFFVQHQRNAAERLTGQKHFSLFSGWQLANNALYMYNHLNGVNTNSFPTRESQELDRYVKDYLSKVPPAFNRGLPTYVGNFFIKEWDAPLKKYYTAHYSKDTSEAESLFHWAQASIVFNDFGSRLIKDHPMAYVRYFLLPNVKSYLIPPLEKLQIYNLGDSTVQPNAVYWFNYKNSFVNSVSAEFQGKLLNLFPSIFLFFNLLFLGSTVYLFYTKKYKALSNDQKMSMLLIALLIIANFIFSTFATVNVFRYQFFPMLLFSSITMKLLDILDPKRNRETARIEAKGQKNTLLETVEAPSPKI